MEAENKKELVPGMTTEEIKAIYFDTNALVEPPYKVYQLNSEGYRYYYRFEGGKPVFYPSVTTLLRMTTPTSPYLIDWMLANGKEGAVEKRDLAAAYGTFMHSQFEALIINRRYDFNAVPAVLSAYMERENLPEKVFSEWLPKVCKDVLAFAQFVKDWKVRPLAVEIGLVHPDSRYAGCIDLVGEMTNPKTGEDFRGIVDFKSGRKGFYEEHELQLHLYKPMWDVNYPEFPIDKVFNFSPKDWRTKPTYNLKDQTDSPNAQKVPHLLALAAIEDEKRDNTVTIVCGKLDLDNGEPEKNAVTLSLSELVCKKAKEETPENGIETLLDEAKEVEPINTTPKERNARKSKINEK